MSNTYIFSSQTAEGGSTRARVLIYDVMKPFTKPRIDWTSEWRNTGNAARDYILGKIELHDRIRDALLRGELE